MFYSINRSGWQEECDKRSQQFVCDNFLCQIHVLYAASLVCPTFLTLQATANVAGLQLGFRLGLFIEATNAGLIISLILEVWVVANHAAKLF